MTTYFFMIKFDVTYQKIKDLAKNVWNWQELS
jgi:hypothetical protein